MHIPFELTPQTRLCFLHIPKTGGTSTVHHFWSAFGRDAVRWIGVDTSEAEILSEGLPDSVRVVGGHVSKTRAIDMLPPGQFVFAAIVREPVARAISLYWHLVNGPDQEELKAELLASDINRGIMRSAAFQETVRDQQCRFLANQFSELPALQAVADAQLALAPFEEAGAFVQALATGMGGEDAAFPHLHTGNKPSTELASETLSLLGELTASDQRLYRFAQSGQ